MIRIRFYDEHGVVLYSSSLTALPISDSAVKAKAYELYCDSDPCAIRRGCVCEVIRSMLTGDVTLDAFLREAVNIPGAVRSETYDD